jgi:hypothetical protein
MCGVACARMHLGTHHVLHAVSLNGASCGPMHGTHTPPRSTHNIDR